MMQRLFLEKTFFQLFPKELKKKLYFTLRAITIEIETISSVECFFNPQQSSTSSDMWNIFVELWKCE